MKKNKLLTGLDYILGIPLLMLFSLWRDVVNILWRPLVRFLWNFTSSKSRAARPRILILKLKGVNDAANMLPALHLLKREFPTAHLTFLGSQQLATFFTKTKLIDRSEVFSFTTFMEMTRAPYMMVIDFGLRTRFTAILTSLFKTPTSVGFKSKGALRHIAYDVHKQYKDKTSQSKNFWLLAREAAEACGHHQSSEFQQDLNDINMKLRSMLFENSLKNIQVSLPENFVVFNLAASQSVKARLWSEENWVLLLEKIKKQNPATEFFLVGNETEENYSKLLQLGAKSWIGKLSFDELFQFFYKAKEIYSIDNEFVAIAGILNDHNTVLLGPTPDVNFENNQNVKVIKTHLECAPCIVGCEDPICLKAIQL